MDAKMRTGLLAVLIVGGMAVLGSAAVFMATADRSERTATPVATAGLLPSADAGAERITVSVPMPKQARPDEMLTKIVKHPFWRVPVNRKQIEALVTTLQGKQAATIFFVDDQFRTGQYTGAAAVATRDQYMMRPDGVGQRNLSIDFFKWQKRPTRQMLLLELLRRLDEADFMSAR
jgi:hypothetical protein